MRGDVDGAHRRAKKTVDTVIAAADWPIQHCYRIERQHMLNSDWLLRKNGINHLQRRVLVCLVERNGRSVNEIAARCGFERTTLSKLLDRIESKGLVSRQVETKDRRRFRVVLTPKGRAIFAKSAPLVLGLFAVYFEAFSKAEMEGCVSMMQRVCAQVDASDAAHAQGRRANRETALTMATNVACKA